MLQINVDPVDKLGFELVDLSLSRSFRGRCDSSRTRDILTIIVSKLTNIIDIYKPVDIDSPTRHHHSHHRSMSPNAFLNEHDDNDTSSSSSSSSSSSLSHYHSPILPSDLISLLILPTSHTLLHASSSSTHQLTSQVLSLTKQLSNLSSEKSVLSTELSRIVSQQQQSELDFSLKLQSLLTEKVESEAKYASEKKKLEKDVASLQHEISIANDEQSQLKKS